MGIDEAGIDIQSFGIEHFAVRRKIGADGFDLAVFDQQVSFVRFSLNHVVDHSVFDEHILFLLYCFRSTFPVRR